MVSADAGGAAAENVAVEGSTAKAAPKRRQPPKPTRAVTHLQSGRVAYAGAMRRALPYRLDYSWAQRGGPVRWTERAVVTLEAVVRSYELTDEVRASIDRWWSALVLDETSPADAPIRASGGCWIPRPALDDAVDPATTTVLLHSHGEDAFDAITSAAQELYAAATRADAGVSIRWSELPHTMP